MPSNSCFLLQGFLPLMRNWYNAWCCYSGKYHQQMSRPLLKTEVISQKKEVGTVFLGQNKKALCVLEMAEI